MSDEVQPALPHPFVRCLFLLPVALGLVLVITAGVMAVQTVKFATTAARTRGEIVGVDRIADFDGYSVQLTLRFSSPDGHAHQIVTSGSSGVFAHKFQTGDTVQVLYAPSNPGNARVNDSALWTVPLFLWIAGFAMAAPFTLVWLATREKYQSLPLGTHVLPEGDFASAASRHQ